VRIVTRAGRALLVPQEALVFDTNEYYAFVAVGGRFERRKVELAPWKDQSLARVTSGLKPGEQVVAAESVQLNELWHQASGEGS
jgi:multidrug efflux pump subunit AcrA (membrane-fusion protein)